MIHLHAFVAIIAQVDDDRGRLLASMFLDQGMVPEVSAASCVGDRGV